MRTAAAHTCYWVNRTPDPTRVMMMYEKWSCEREELGRGVGRSPLARH